MDASRTALVQGWTDTRTTLVDWNAKPGRVVGAWLAASAVIGVGLLMAVWAIAGVSMPDPSALLRPGSGRVGTLGDAWRIVARNCLVLALHAMACVAGFIAGSSLPLQAATQSGRVRWIHERAGPLAIAFVIAATGFSLVTQAWVLGAGTSTLAAQLHTSPGVLLLALSPHAVLELTALFLPLAAWIAASRRHAWNQLLAATFATVGLAVPMLILAALIEVFVSPHFVSVLTR